MPKDYTDPFAGLDRWQDPTERDDSTFEVTGPSTPLWQRIASNAASGLRAYMVGNLNNDTLSPFTMVDSAIRAVTLPARVAAGQTPPDDLAENWNFVGNMAAGAGLGSRPANSVGTFLSPTQLRRAQAAGHIEAGEWGSAEALARANRAMKNAPPAGHPEFSGFANDVYQRHGWDFGNQRIGHPITEVDSSNVRLNPQGIRNGEGIDTPLRHLLTNVDRGSLIGDAEPRLANMPVKRWAVGPDQQPSGMFSGNAVQRALADTPEHLEAVLRHEALGHGIHTQWANPRGVPFADGFRSAFANMPVEMPGQSKALLDLQSKLPTGNPASEELMRRVKQAGDYLAKPVEQYARLIEDPKGASRTTAPSQRDAYTTNSLQRKTADFPFAFEDFRLMPE